MQFKRSDGTYLHISTLKAIAISPQSTVIEKTCRFKMGAMHHKLVQIKDVYGLSLIQELLLRERGTPANLEYEVGSRVKISVLRSTNRIKADFSLGA